MVGNLRMAIHRIKPAVAVVAEGPSGFQITIIVPA